MNLQKPTDEAVAKGQEVPEAPVDDSIVLEMALYQNYNFQGRMYEKGKPYRFTRMDALRLLNEQDSGRPVWRIYRKPVPRHRPTNDVQDMTVVSVNHSSEPIHGIEEGPKSRIDVGEDHEIADVLDNVGDEVV